MRPSGWIWGLCCSKIVGWLGGDPDKRYTVHGMPCRLLAMVGEDPDPASLCPMEGGIVS